MPFKTPRPHDRSFGLCVLGFRPSTSFIPQHRHKSIAKVTRSTELPSLYGTHMLSIRCHLGPSFMSRGVSKSLPERGYARSCARTTALTHRPIRGALTQDPPHRASSCPNGRRKRASEIAAGPGVELEHAGYRRYQFTLRPMFAAGLPSASAWSPEDTTPIRLKICRSPSIRIEVRSVSPCAS